MADSLPFWLERVIASTADVLCDRCKIQAEQVGARRRCPRFRGTFGASEFRALGAPPEGGLNRSPAPRGAGVHVWRSR